MKNIKSLIAILLVCALFFSVASCGKETTDETTATTTLVSTETDTTFNEVINYDTTYTEYSEYSDTSANAPDTSTPAENSTSNAVEVEAPTPQVQNNNVAAPQEAVVVTTTTQAPTTKASVPKTTTSKTEKPKETQNATVPQQNTSHQTIHQTENGTYYIYYPENIKTSKNTYPVLSWANGTMCPPDLYTNLLIEISKGGYIVIASDETMAADGSAQIAALDFVISLNNDSSNPAYKKVNTKKLGVIGHSQGGRSSVNAAVKDSRIKCVVSLAGSNYLEEAEPNATPTFFIAGGKDMIVSPSQWIQPAYDVAKGPAVYASLNGAIHTTCCSEPGKYSAYILDWCDAWLKGNSKALNTFKTNGTLATDSNWSNFQCKGF